MSRCFVASERRVCEFTGQKIANSAWAFATIHPRSVQCPVAYAGLAASCSRRWRLQRSSKSASSTCGSLPTRRGRLHV